MKHIFIPAAITAVVTTILYAFSLSTASGGNPPPKKRAFRPILPKNYAQIEAARYRPAPAKPAVIKSVPRNQPAPAPAPTTRIKELPIPPATVRNPEAAPHTYPPNAYDWHPYSGSKEKKGTSVSNAPIVSDTLEANNKTAPVISPVAELINSVSPPKTTTETKTRTTKTSATKPSYSSPPSKPKPSYSKSTTARRSRSSASSSSSANTKSRFNGIFGKGNSSRNTFFPRTTRGNTRCIGGR